MLDIDILRAEDDGMIAAPPEPETRVCDDCGSRNVKVIRTAEEALNMWPRSATPVLTRCGDCGWVMGGAA